VRLLFLSVVFTGRNGTPLVVSGLDGICVVEFRYDHGKGCK
jgi:hypothetical protein